MIDQAVHRRNTYSHLKTITKDENEKLLLTSLLKTI